MHIRQVITHSCALQMKRLLRDKHFSERVKHTLILTAPRLFLEYGAELLVPTKEHARAFRGLQLKAAPIILHCLPTTFSDITTADIRLQLLSPFRSIAKWLQRSLCGLPADRLYRYSYDHGLPDPVQAQRRHRRKWRQAEDCIWGTSSELDM